MNCANHPDAAAIAYCRECGKPMCEACRHQADGTTFCEEHAPRAAWPAEQPAATTAAPYTAPASPYTAPASPYTASDPSPYTAPLPPRPVDPGASPGLAFMLGFIPGVGAIYNGQYVKGFIHVVIMGFLIAIVNNEELSGNLQPLFGMMIAVWVFYMAFEAYHTAKKRQMGEPVDEFSSIVPRKGHASRFPIAPVVLIAVGLIFLLQTLDILRIAQLLRYWPIALIAVGVYMLYERMSGSTEHSGHDVPPREAAREPR
jgi:hypothetical protein